MIVDDVLLPCRADSDVNSLSVVVVTVVVVVGAGVVIGLSVEKHKRQTYSIGSHGLRTSPETSETNLK